LITDNQYLRQYEDVLESLPLHIRQQVKPSEELLKVPWYQSSDPFTVALCMLNFFRKSERCNREGCEKTIKSEGREFGRCARCKVARFCAKECQRLAWPEHKKMCNDIRAVTGGQEVSFYESPTNRDFTEAVGAFKRKCLANGVSESVLHEFNQKHGPKCL
jgi:hypothetical protein